jgi:hypothetical protein
VKIFGHLSGFPSFDALVVDTTAATAAELAVRMGRATAEI